jgi:ferric-dicitrate binding protein FerR (iron transport regulator)
MIALRRMLIGLMALMVFGGASGQNPEPATLPVGSATIAEMKGEVTFHSATGDVLTAQPGTALEAESKIDTAKGSVLLNLQDGSQVLVKGNSHVVLKAPTAERGFWLELLLGKINAQIQKRLGNSPSFRMGTPTAVITVRGTKFSVDVNKKQKTSVEVFEGLVEVSGLHGGALGAPVLLKPGFATGVDQNHDPEQPHGMQNRDMNDDRSNSGFGGLGRSGHGDDDHQKPGTQPQNNPTGSGEHDHEDN